MRQICKMEEKIPTLKHFNAVSMTSRCFFVPDVNWRMIYLLPWNFDSFLLLTGPSRPLLDKVYIIKLQWNKYNSSNIPEESANFEWSKADESLTKEIISDFHKNEETIVEKYTKKAYGEDWPTLKAKDYLPTYNGEYRPDLYYYAMYKNEFMVISCVQFLIN
jgi:hypothetical protein